MKKKYVVTNIYCVSVSCEVEAESESEAEDFAMEIIEEPSLCHQCTRACGDLNYDETTVELIEDDNQ